MVFSFVRDPSLHDELVQELIIHLWQTEAARPDQTPSWYRRSCFLHLLDMLRHGRSLDSLKRRHRALPWPEEAVDSETQPASFLPVAEEDPFSHISVHDALHELRSNLASREQAVLALVTQEFTVDEIALRLNLSHATVCASTARIRATATQLGLGK
jgi:DNA-directed RNA polymerase specialized sigma24 family protein